MDDGVERRTTKQPPLVPTNVGLDDAYALGKTGDVAALHRRVVKIIEVVEYGNFVTPREQCLHHVRPDKARSTCDQDVHCVPRLDAHVSHSLNTINVHSARA